MSEIRWKPEHPSRADRLRAWLRRTWRRVRRVAGIGLRRFRWAPPLGLGLILGIAALVGLQCALGADLSDVDIGEGGLDRDPDLYITLTNAFLTRQIQQSVDRGSSPIPLKNVRVTTRDVQTATGKEGRLFVTGDVEFLGRGVGGVIEMRPVLEEGKVRMKVVEAKFGIFPVPGNVERLVEAPINDRVDAAVAGYPATITSVRAVPEGITVTARLRPRDATATASMTATTASTAAARASATAAASPQTTATVATTTPGRGSPSTTPRATSTTTSSPASATPGQ